MRAAIMPEPGKIEMIDVTLPEMQEDEVLIDVKAVGICTFEQGYYYGKSQGFPFAGGHEICGVVEKAGSKVAQKLKPGDKVIVLSLTRCGECYYCYLCFHCLPAFPVPVRLLGLSLCHSQRPSPT